MLLFVQFFLSLPASKWDKAEICVLANTLCSPMEMTYRITFTSMLTSL